MLLAILFFGITPKVEKNGEKNTTTSITDCSFVIYMLFLAKIAYAVGIEFSREKYDTLRKKRQRKSIVFGIENMMIEDVPIVR